MNRASVCRLLEQAGCVAASDEARELLARTRHPDELEALVARRCQGEPLAWLTGRSEFCGLQVRVTPGVYVPRWQSEPLAWLAAQLLPDHGVGVDLCCGTGALAMVMRAAHPGAQVVASDIDLLSVRCARSNGLRAYHGDLDEGLPAQLASRVDVLAAVVPYVPRGGLRLLPRDVVRFEPTRALDGGESGLDLVSKVVATSPRWLKAGGWLLVEVGMDQIEATRALLAERGFDRISTLVDQDGDPRGVRGAWGDHERDRR